MSDDRPHCRQPAACKAKTAGKHCSPCNLSALHKDPAFRAKRAAGFRERLKKDPDFRAAHVAACQARMDRWRKTPEGAAALRETGNSNLAKANEPQAVAKRREVIRSRAYAGIPVDRHDEVRMLARRMPAAEAKRIVMEDEAVRVRRLEDERAQARRAIAEINVQQRARHARQKAQEY